MSKPFVIFITIAWSMVCLLNFVICLSHGGVVAELGAIGWLTSGIAYALWIREFSHQKGGEG